MARDLNLIKVITHSSGSVTNTTSQILAANERRLYAEIVNSSSTGVWLYLGTGPAVVGTGIYLAPNGFSYVINTENMWRGAVQAIAGSAGPHVVGIHEGQ